MLITTNYWIKSDHDNETRNITQFKNEYNNYSNISQEFEPIWISLSLISSKYHNYFEYFLFFFASYLHDFM